MGNCVFDGDRVGFFLFGGVDIVRMEEWGGRDGGGGLI